MEVKCGFIITISNFCGHLEQYNRKTIIAVTFIIKAQSNFVPKAADRLKAILQFQKLAKFVPSSTKKTERTAIYKQLSVLSP
jgi:hypothetical protein